MPTIYVRFPLYIPHLKLVYIYTFLNLFSFKRTIPMVVVFIGLKDKFSPPIIDAHIVILNTNSGTEKFFVDAIRLWGKGARNIKSEFRINYHGELSCIHTPVLRGYMLRYIVIASVLIFVRWVLN